MARIQLQGLAHAYRPEPRTPADYALQPMDFAWDDGGAYALLGPSGCGKTTLLNIISGLIRPSEGRVLFDDRDVTLLPPAERNIAQVFQFPVVYDTMSVFDNLAFPLRNRGIAAGEVRRRVGEVAEMLELAPMLERRAARLTADQKQKISLGRGLVRSDVAAILFDEPLTVIDPHLKWLLRRKLKQVHEQFRRTLVYVTHDQNEALTFAERVVVMLDGQVVQVGTPQELFERPAHRFVGYFIGSPGMNFMALRRENGGIAIAGTDILLGPGFAARAPAGVQELELGIRPEFLEVRAEAAGDALPARIIDARDLGNFSMVTARLGDHELKAKVPEGTAVPAGEAWLAFPERWTRLYADGRLVG